MKNYIIILVSFLFISCDVWDSRLRVINKTNKTVVVGDWSWSADTLDYVDNKEPIDNFFFHEYQISPNRFRRFTHNGNWELLFENDTLVLLVFDKEAILKKRAEKPKENYDIEKMIHVSKEYVKKNDWKITIDSSMSSRIIKL